MRDRTITNIREEEKLTQLDKEAYHYLIHQVQMQSPMEHINTLHKAHSLEYALILVNYHQVH